MRQELILACATLLTGLTGLTGCADPSNCSALDPADARLELGEGQDHFSPLDPGTTMEVERGNQGGQHIWVAVRAEGIAPGSETLWDGLSNDDLPEVEAVVTGPDGVISADNRRPRVLARGERGEYLLLQNMVVIRHFAELPDNWAELDYAEVEADMEEVDHDLTVRIEDVCGVTVAASAPIRLDFPARGSGPPGGLLSPHLERP
jgi:hypothetical protein